MKKLLASALLSGLLAAPLVQADESPKWGYSGSTSPAHWGEISDEFSACGTGDSQSPIDITTSKVKTGNLETLDNNYQASAGKLANNGHSIQIDLEDAGAIDTPSGQYDFVQFHFHTPSEEKIDGVTYPLVAHLVNQDDEGNIAVVAVLYKVGDKNKALEKIFDDLPEEESTQTLDKSFNPADLLPEEGDYYAYDGSLTTPPCSEDVQWYIMKEPVELSRHQLEQFQKVFPMNARPTQPINGRTVESSN